MHLIQVITWKLPTARCGTSGSGDDEVLVHWDKNNESPQPTPEQIVQWKQEYVEQGIEQEQEALSQLNSSVAVQALIAEVAPHLNLTEDELREAVKDRVKSILQDGS